MAEDINYRQLMNKAFRQVMVDVLSQVAREGLPGSHHFLISFETTHPGVDMADFLRQRYPTEMTIVLQDWFDDLAVMKDRFSVVLNFGNMPEKLVVPFEAIKTFVDPSVELGFKFEAHEVDGLSEDGESDDGDEPPEPNPPAPHQPSGDAEVVSLAKFREKH